MTNDWQYALYIGYIFLFLIVGKLIKEKLGLFRSIIIPTALLAGFLGLIAGPEVLGIIKFDLTFYSLIVSHSMALAFIALTFSSKPKEKNKDALNSGIFIISNYVYQGIIGMITVFILIKTIRPDIFPGLGLILPLAFGQGPGFASSIGRSWDQTIGVDYINQFGLSLATTGFIVGGVVGVILLNIFVKKNNIKFKKLNTLKGLVFKDFKLTALEEINFFDTLTVQFAFIFFTYLLTYGAMQLSITLLSNLGTIGHTIASLVKGFNFLFGILLALLVKTIINKFTKDGHRASQLIDSFFMQNISSMLFTVMITSSVMAISVKTVAKYLDVLAIISVVGAVTTLVFILWFGKKVFKKDTIHYILAMFGMLTGTASTGIALLRGIDSDLQTDVARNLVLGSAIATPLALPLMATLSLPIMAYTTGNSNYYLATLGILFVYLIGLVIWGILRNRKKSKS